MDRKEFLSLLGFSTASAALVSCLGGCKKDAAASAANTTGPAGVDFTLDISQPANAALQTNGGYLYSHNIIVAKTVNGDYIAVQQSCTHEQFTLAYEASQHLFYCDGHGATYSETGAVTGGPAPRNLTTYKTQLSGNMLRVYS